MSSRQQQIAPEQAVQQVQSTDNTVTGPSNSEINGHLIESLFSKDYMVEPTDSTTVDDAGGSEIVVTATRSQLPASALPLTIDVIDSEALERQVLVNGKIRL